MEFKKLILSTFSFILGSLAGAAAPFPGFARGNPFFQPDRHKELTDFINVPTDRLSERRERTEWVNQFRFQIDRVADPSLVTRHPHVLEMAAALGYDALAVDRQAAARRCERSPVRRVARNIVRALLGRYYNPIRRRMVERRQARNSPGSAL